MRFTGHLNTDLPTDQSVRNDVAGALDLILKDAPYGPNVEEAKVRGMDSGSQNMQSDSLCRT